MPLHRRLPKRGFKNPFRKEFAIINLTDIDKAIASKKINPLKEISKAELLKAGLIRKNCLGVKLLANGKLSQSVTIKVDKASKKASESISKIKGKLILEVTKEKNIKKMKSKKSGEIKMPSAAEQLASSVNFGALAKATELKNRIIFTLLASSCI